MQPTEFHCAKTLILSAAVALAFLLASTRAEAIPAFARKYQTSCQTCHIAFPKLNPFGEAFRLRGYRMPAETEELIKETPVELGAEAYKRVWPDAVWPSDMPGTFPFSFDLAMSDRTQRLVEEGMGDTIKNDFRFPETLTFLTGGTLGDTLSFLGDVGFARAVANGESRVEVEIEHAALNFNGPWGSGVAFNLKIGRLVPELVQHLSHNYVLTSGGPASVFQFQAIGPEGGAEVAAGHEGGVGIALPEYVDGIEAYGILGHRFLYSGGFANGIGPGAESMDGNTGKDVFGRVAYKFGGLPFDGEGYVASDKNWREKSLRVAVFGYRGDGKGIFVPVEAHGGQDPMGAQALPRVLEDRAFSRIGFDASVYFQDLNVIAGYVRGRDTLAEYVDVGGGARTFDQQGSFTYHTWFAEGDYVLMPWLHGALRYEWLQPAREGASDFKRIVPNLTALIRANVKAFIEYQRDLGDSDNYLVLANVRFAF